MDLAGPAVEVERAAPLQAATTVWKEEIATRYSCLFASSQLMIMLTDNLLAKICVSHCQSDQIGQFIQLWVTF